MEKNTKKNNIQEKELSGVTGGIPGELICHAASNVVNILFSSNNAESAGNAPSNNSTGAGKESQSKK